MKNLSSALIFKLVVLTALLLGCKTVPIGDKSPRLGNDAAAEDAGILPDANDADHKITALEIITIDVFGEKELSKEFRVQAGGKISFPLLGDLEVADKTTREVESLLREKLSQGYLVDPQVVVTVKEYRLRHVNVIGELNKPGAVPLIGEQKWTILDVISQAGGFSKLANTRKIEFTRQGHTRRFTLDELKTANDPDKIVWLEPGDTIFVPQTVW